MNLLHFQSLSNYIFGVIFASSYNVFAYKQLSDKIGIIHITMKKKVVLQLALQLIIFLRCECYSTSYKSCKSCRVAIHCIYGATHCNSIVIMLKQLNFNYYATPL
jgi:hypothetical protein